MEKAGLIGLVRMRLLAVDEKLSLRGKTLHDAIEEDKRNGYIPFYVRIEFAEVLFQFCFSIRISRTFTYDFAQLCATLGTTGACAFDNLQELGPICESDCIGVLSNVMQFLCLQASVKTSGCTWTRRTQGAPSSAPSFDIS